MKTCYFQGTFNPPHNGHLLIAEFVLKNTEYEKVVFVPAYKPPHKALKEENPLHRLNMTKILVKNKKGLEVSDIEFQREEQSYTYVTVKNLISSGKEKDRPAIIIGDDAFDKIETWYKTEELKNIVDFVLIPRENGCSEEKLKNLEKKGYNYKRLNMPFVDISSTKIRNLIEKNLPTDDLIPEEIRRYADENNLY